MDTDLPAERGGERTARHMEAAWLKRRTSSDETRMRAGADTGGGEAGGCERLRKSPRLVGAAATPGLTDPEQRKRRRADTERGLRKRRAVEGQARTGAAPSDPRTVRRDRDDRIRRDHSQHASAASRESAGVRRSGR